MKGNLFNIIRAFELNYPFTYKIVMKGLFVLMIWSITGSSNISLDGESSDEGDSSSTKVKSEFSQINKNTTETGSSDLNKNNSDSKPNSSDVNVTTQGELLKDRPEKLSDMFEKLYLRVHEHENNILTEERKEYERTGTLANENFHDKMGDLRKNDHTNLLHHTKLSDITSPEGDSDLTQNKRNHLDAQDDNNSDKETEVVKKQKKDE